MTPRQREVLAPEDLKSDSSMEDVKNKPVEKCDSPSPSDLARDEHDIFNLYALVPVIVLNLVNWKWADFIRGDVENAWTGVYFTHLWVATALYFLMDLLWVMRVPICVKNPGLIIKHHTIAIMYLLAPLKFPEYRWFMGLIISVEINTWFLIARRVLVYRREVGKVLSDIITASFYISWIIIRCIIYPGILYVFLSMAHEAIIRTQSIMHMQLLWIPAHAFLVVLNLKWTYDLFLPIIKRWLSSEPDSSAPRISSGL